MIYKKFQDSKISALGMGMMRLPQKDDKYSHIDEKATEEMIDYAIKKGVNYFDTAWGYHDGVSELVTGKILSKYKRDSFYLATKFPGYDLANMTKVKEIFRKQLEKCRVDYFDFYLFHNVCEMNIDAYLDPKYGVYDYLIEQKRNGRIKHLGFSCHGDLPVLKRFLDAYGKDMEFCQLQINWLDWKFQSAEQKVKMCNDYGVPVWVMEPVRGGKLVNLEPHHEKRLRALRSDESNVGWAFRFIQSIPTACMTLSGMSNFEQLKQNIEIFETEKPLNDEELKALQIIADEMTGKRLPCTECKYCTSHCPKELNIPEIIKLYNEHVFSEGGFIAPMALSAFPEDKLPSACVGCRSCEAVCPQKIKISEMMTDFVSKTKD